MIKRSPFALAVLHVIIAVSVATAQLPETHLGSIYPAGAQAGQSLTLEISGVDLDAVNQLEFSHPGISATQKLAEAGPFEDQPQPVENQFEVKVHGDVPSGQYEVRCRGKYGLSNPRAFQVDSLTEYQESEPNQDPDTATEVSFPGIINGQLKTTSDHDLFQFEGKQGQQLTIDALARRIDSKSELMVTLQAPDGRTLQQSQNQVQGDPLINLTLPQNGNYLIKVRDSLHRGGAEYVYRLVLSTRPQIDFVFPPAGLLGSNDKYTVYGRNLPGGKASRFTIDGTPLQQFETNIPIPKQVADQLDFDARLDPHQAGLDGFTFRIDSPAGKSNAFLMTVAGAKRVLEQAENDSPQQAQSIDFPCEIHGQFYPKRDIDWFTFEATAGQKLAIDLLSHRLGQPTDPSLLIQRVTLTDEGEEKLQQIVWHDELTTRIRDKGFDHRHNDPTYLFTAPTDGTYRLMVRDSYSSVQSDPRLVYRLCIRQPQPDFRLAASPIDHPGSILIRKGGRTALRITAYRRDGFDGEITVTASGLPAGVTTDPIIIGPGNDYGVLVLTAAADAPGATSTLAVQGTSTVNGQSLKRLARYGRVLETYRFQQPNANVSSIPARLTPALMLTVSNSEQSLVSCTTGDGKTIETARGGVIKIPYQVKRAEGVGGNLTGYPLGLPPNVNLNQVAMAANEKGEFELKLQATTVPGTYTFYLACSAQGFQYSRNPEATEAAVARQERFATILADAKKKTLETQKSAQDAARKLTQTGTDLKTAQTAVTNAGNAVTAAQKELQDATKRQQDATKQLAAKPDDAAMNQAVAEAAKAVTAATEKVNNSQTTMKTATDKATAISAQQKAEQEAKTNADKAYADAQQTERLAQQEKQRADQAAQQAKQRSNKRSTNFSTASTPITIKVASYPIVPTLPNALTVKQGENAEVTFAIERLYGFDSNVSIQPRLPGGVGGLSIPTVNLDKAKKAAVVNVTANATATPGEHEMTFRLQMNFNGQNLTLEHPFKLTVIEVEKK